MTYHSLTPAYGRDFKSKAEVEAALLAGKDFVLQPLGCYANLESFKSEPGSSLSVRYKGLRSVAVFKVSALLKKREEARANQASDADFDAWMLRVDKLCKRRTGLSYQDFVDIDYAGLFEAGSSPAAAVDQLLEEA